MTIDTISPVLTLDTPTQNGTYYNTPPYFNGTCTDTNLDTVRTNITEYNTSTTSPFNITNKSALINQRYDVNITCNDSAGNTVSEIFWLTYDAIQPNITFVDPTDTNNDYVNRNYSYVNVTATDTNNITTFIDWNNSLVGWWRFNEEAGENSTFFRDWSSYGNNGSCAGDTCSTYTIGKFGKALQFDGVDDYVSITDSDTLTLSSGFSISMWVNPDNVDPVDGEVIMQQYDAVSQDGFYIRNEDVGSGQFGFAVFVGGSNDAIVSNSPPTGGYQFLVVSRDDDGNMGMYIDGILQTATGNQPGEINSSADLYIGQQYNDVRRFPGIIDEVRIFNRDLSPEEINASYNAGLHRLYHNFTDLADGTYTYTAYAQDLAGNVNQAETRTVTIIQPTDNAYVDDNNICAGNTPCFTVIQTAIDSSVVNPGAMIYVYNGTYTEQVDVTKNVILEGESNAGTQVIGGFNVSVNDTTIKNFNISGGYVWDPDGSGLGGAYKTGIYATSFNNTFENNRISGITAGAGGNGVSDPTSGGAGGIASSIYLSFSTSNSITLNNISSLTGGAGGTGGNYGTGGTGGTASGIYLFGSTNNSLVSNVVSSLTIGTAGAGGSSGTSGIAGTKTAIWL
ncbi:MAG: hypothetical protein KAQ92_05085, partial [Candidatus Aenigmarchaeota archaeon]|nr:hypothetical protein [Candidatus Aenigmarchaeota archaeon]